MAVVQNSRCCFLIFLNFVIVTLLLFVSIAAESSSMVYEKKQPSVVIAFLVRNKAHTLPYFLTLLERLDYPKERISLWIRSDHNEDKTLEILKKWLSSVESDYHSINAELLSSPPKRLKDEKGPAHWSASRFMHVIQLREEALMSARQLWAEYLWFLDADVFITNHQTLQLLMEKDRLVVAPALKSDGLYSNFWCGMTDNFYYQRTDDYKPILSRERVGCFHVPMVHSSMLMDLRMTASDNLTYVGSNIPDYEGPHDDIITFALAANKSDIPLYVCNDHVYGFVMVPLEQTDELKQDFIQLTNLKLEVLVENSPLPVSGLLSGYVSYPEPDMMAFDVVFTINLRRRPERRRRMVDCFRELGVRSVIVDAVDGRFSNGFKRLVASSVGVDQDDDAAHPQKTITSLSRRLCGNSSLQDSSKPLCGWKKVASYGPESDGTTSQFAREHGYVHSATGEGECTEGRANSLRRPASRRQWTVEVGSCMSLDGKTDFAVLEDQDL